MIDEDFEKHIWCDGDCKDENAIYFDDGNEYIYEYNGVEYICTKHHWQCPKCNKIVQVG